MMRPGKDFRTFRISAEDATELANLAKEFSGAVTACRVSADCVLDALARRESEAQIFPLLEVAGKAAERATQLATSTPERFLQIARKYWGPLPAPDLSGLLAVALSAADGAWRDVATFSVHAELERLSGVFKSLEEIGKRSSTDE